MEIAIPSAFRSNGGLKTLAQVWDDPRLSATFYVPDDQYAEYRRYLPGSISLEGVRDSKTVSDARNAIMRDFAGSRLVIMEDDVPYFVGSRHCFAPTRHGAPPSTPRLHIYEVARMGFNAMDYWGTGIWGIYPVAYSGTQLKPRIAYGDLFLVGHAIGMDVPSAPPFLTLPVKEDYELSAWAIDTYDGVVRLDCIAPYSTSGKGAGGTNVYRTPELERYCADMLMAKWPHLFHRKGSGKGRQGMAQVAIKGNVAYEQVEVEDGWFPYAP